MGLFDKFLNKNNEEALVPETKEQEAVEENNTDEKEENESPIFEGIEISNEYTMALKQASFGFLPQDLDSIESQLKITTMINPVVGIDIVKLKTESIWEHVKKLSVNVSDSMREEWFKKALRETINAVEGAIKYQDEEYIAENIKKADKRELLEAWIALDYYIFCDKDGCKNICNLKNYIASKIIERGNSPKSEPELNEMEVLQKKCCEEMKQNPESEHVKELKKEIGEKLMELNKIYIAYDEDFNSAFPYITADGRIEVFTTPQRATAFKEYAEKSHIGHVIIRFVNKDGIEAFFKNIWNMGVSVIRLDNGFAPVDLWFEDFCNFKATVLTDAKNRNMRGCFLRELQYSYRIRKMDESQKGGGMQHTLMEMMLSMRYTAYRDLGNGLVYVLLADVDGNNASTLYTQKAYEKAEKVLENNKDLSLVSDGDEKYEVYGGKINLRLATKNTENEANSLVYAFSDKKMADIVLKQSINNGNNDAVLLMTFDELYTHAMQCEGILMDAPSYGLKILKKEFNDIAKWRQVKGPIMVKLKKPEEKTK